MTLSNYIQPKTDRIAEQRLLGAITCDTLNNNEIAQVAFEQVLPEYFYYQDNRELFELIKERFLNDLPYDIASIIAIVPNELADLVLQLADERFYTITMFNSDLTRLQLLYDLRPKLKSINNLFYEMQQQNDPDKCLQLLSESLSSIQRDVIEGASDCQDYYQLVDDVLTQPEEPEEIKTALRDWPPFPSSGMITIAGRSGTGKTFTGLFLMEHLLNAMPDTKAIYFNLEMKPKVLIKRHLNMISDMDGTLKESLEKNGASELLKRDVHVVTRPGITIDEIELITTSQNLKKKVSVIVVDYIGQVVIKNRAEKEYISQGEIAQRLAGLAVKTGCIVLVLQQVNRETKNAGIGNIPTLGEAAGSQGCERSSEWWIGIHKPDIYDPDNLDIKDLFIFKNQKQRGEHGYFTVFCEFKDGKFYEINQYRAKQRYQAALNSSNKDPFESRYKNK